MSMTIDRLVGEQATAPTGYDLIIVGAGTAGLACALAAAESGAKVLVFEKTNRIGGTLHISGGNISAGGTRRQRAKGIEDSPDAHFADVMRISKGRANAKLVRLACDLAPATADWLEDNGLVMADTMPVITYGHEPYQTARTYWGVDSGKTLVALFERLLAPYLVSGQVEIRLETPVDHLLTEGERVVGVAAAGASVRASSVVLTTGGFGANGDLFARLSAGFRPISVAPEFATGDGLLMAESLGAAIANDGVFLPTIGGFEDPERPGRYLQASQDTWHVRPTMAPQFREPWEVWVDNNGERFVREDEPSVDVRENAVKDKANLRFWVVWDEAILRVAPPIVAAWGVDGLRRQSDEGVLVHRAGSIAELAATMGVPAATLAETITAYNAAQTTGAPDPLGRTMRPRPVTEPPFYAMRQHGITLLSWPGLAVNSDLQVERADGSAIPGLYAIGEVLGLATFCGVAFCGGMSVGPAIAFGRLVGERIGRRVGRLES